MRRACCRGMADQSMFPQIFKSLPLSSALIAVIGVGLVAIPGAVFMLATCGALLNNALHVMMLQAEPPVAVFAKQL